MNATTSVHQPDNDKLVLRGCEDVPSSSSISGILLSSQTELSFWGGVDYATSEIIDRHHPLSGRYLQDTILAIPGGRGSCGGSTVIMELLYNGKSPKALIFERREEIITFGVMLAEELFQKSIPVIVLRPQDFQLLSSWNGRTVFVHGGHISDRPLPRNFISDESMNGTTAEPGVRNSEVKLSSTDQEFLNGKRGEAGIIAMKVLLKMARLMETSELISVKQVHIDACLYVGPASLAIPSKLRDLGGKVQVPTTMNAISIDKQRWRKLGVDCTFGEASEALADTYLDMGAKPTFTCSPYQLDSAPQFGDQVAWGESNAVVYANSVLGARTIKYPDFLDVAVALTGRAPKAGVYLDENRRASVWVRVPSMPNSVDDSFWPILGTAVGTLSPAAIPVVTGLFVFNPTKDDLKAFGAAFATYSSAPMFHLVGITPEASTVEVVSKRPVEETPCVDLDWALLQKCWKEFNANTMGIQVDLISLGNPHFSLREIKEFAKLCAGRTKAQVDLVITCSRSVHGLASQAGWVQDLERFGGHFVTDTCWCMIQEPIILPSTRVIMTNSGKYAHYGPGLTGREFCFGSLKMCAEVACRGLYSGEMPPWLQGS